MLVHFVAESAKCTDGTLDNKAFLDTGVAFIAVKPAAIPIGFDITFRIDENGRALDISKTSNDLYPFNTSDIAPAVAASRFNSGKPRFGCTVRYVPQISEIADASLNRVFEYSIFPNIGRQRAIFDRLKPQGSTCFDSPPAVLTRSYPDFSEVPATPGRSDWSMTQFDIDASGKPVQLLTVGGTGNKSLDKASLAAVASSRFANEARKGCLYPYWRTAGPVMAPDAPEQDAFRTEKATCPKDVVWASKNPATYPERFRKRYVEGWAIIVFDVAPWGSTGNVKIAAAQPAVEFGDAAAQVVKSRKVENSGEAWTGCVERVRFVMNPKLPAGTQDSLGD